MLEVINVKLRDQMPGLEGATDWLNSKPLSKTNWIGEVPVLVYFWSVSCETCKNAIPKLNQLYNSYDGRLAMIAVHMPRTQGDYERAEVRRSAEAHHISQPILIDNDHQLTSRFKTRYVPAFYLFDQDGRLRHKHSGHGGIRTLERRISKIITEIN